MLRRLDLLITQARRQSENEEFTDTTGIGDDEIIQYCNDAQTQMQAAISNVYAEVFQTETTINAVPRQEAYDIPSDALLGNRVDLVEYTNNGNERDYYILKQGRISERFSGINASTPAFYIRRSGQLLLQPIPDDGIGKIRLTYQKRLPTLDIRRAKVGSVTLDNVGNTITSLTFDTTQTIDESVLEEQGFITIVDKNGNIKMKSIPVDDVDAGSGTVTVEAGFTFEEGETIEVGDYAVSGEDATTHSQLQPICERYIIQYMVWKILKRDSSNDALEASQELQALQSSIVESFSQPDSDVDYVSILDPQFIRFETEL